jgi:hypothetical protein
MTTPYDMQDPIEMLLSKIETDVCYANSGGQSLAPYVNIALLLVLETGVTPLACAEWQRRLPA